MKKIGLLLLALVVVGFGATGCGKKDADVVGTWTILLDEGCAAGADLAVVAHMFDNDTFILDGGLSGTYSVNKDDITMNLDGGYLIFSGSVDGGSMTGNFVGAASGCWSAVRTSTSP
jgi:hypothetical protein